MEKKKIYEEDGGKRSIHDTSANILPVQSAFSLSSGGNETAPNITFHHLHSTILSRPILTKYNETRGYEATVFTFKGSTLLASDTVVVTAYYDIKSKYPGSWYDEWTQNMLAMTDPMVIFTSPDRVLQMAHGRQHAPDATVIIALQLNNTQIMRQYPSQDFWKQQVEKDPWKKKHRYNPDLYVVWLSKPWFVMEAIVQNWFKTASFYTWTDMGCFRNAHAARRVYKKAMVTSSWVVPPDRIAHMAHRIPQVPPRPWYDDKFGDDSYFYHSGSIMAANVTVWHPFYHAFQFTVGGFVERNLFVGEDQMVLQSCCLLFENLCAYPLPGQVADNKYFALRTILQQGKMKFKWWSPPNQTEWDASLRPDFPRRQIIDQIYG